MNFKLQCLSYSVQHMYNGLGDVVDRIYCGPKSLCVTNLRIRARPPRDATRPPPTRPRRIPRLPTRVLKAKILHQFVGIRFVHNDFCPQRPSSEKL